MVTIRTTKGDYSDEITFTCKDDTGAVINLSGAASVKIYVGRFGESTLLVDGDSCTVEDASNGVVSYVFVNGVLDTNKYYDAQLEINWSAGGIKRLKPFTIHVLPQLA